MYFCKLIPLFVLLTCVIADDKLKIYYKDLEDVLNKKYGNGSKIKESLMRSFKNEETILREKNKILGNIENLSPYNISKYIKCDNCSESIKLSTNSTVNPTTPRENNYLMCFLIVLACCVICLLLFVIHRNWNHKKRNSNTTDTSESKCMFEK